MVAQRLSWDERKRQSNLKKHGLDFAHVVDFDDENALTAEDIRGRTDPRFVYPERRYVSLGLMRGRIVVLVYAPMRDGAWRVISLRLADDKEKELWLEK